MFAGVDIVNSISVAWNNQIIIEETVTLGITQFHVGSQNNIFDDNAYIGGSLRYFDFYDVTLNYAIGKMVKLTANYLNKISSLLYV